MLGVEACPDQRFEEIGRRCAELEPDHPPASAFLQRRSELANQVLGVLLDFNVAVAQHAKGAGASQFEARKDEVEVRCDHLVDRNEARVVAGQADEPADRGGDHQHFVDRLAIRRFDHRENERIAAVGNEREGVRRVDRERGEDRQDLAREPVAQPFALDRCQRVWKDHAHALLGEQRNQLSPRGLLLIDQSVRLAADQRQLLSWQQTVLRRLLEPFELLLLEPGDPNHEKLVEVGPADRQEPHSLEQGMRGVGRLLEHPAVERQPRHFAIEIAGRRTRPRGRGLDVGRHVHSLCSSFEPASISPAVISARRTVGTVSRDPLAIANRSIASTSRSAVQ